MREDRAAPAVAALLIAALAILHTWPLATAPARLFFKSHADAQLNAWIVSWIPHALATSPRHLFDANIFAPEVNTLAYSEPLIVPALLGAPLRALGASPVLTFNVLLMAGLALTGWSAWFLAWRWTGSASAALVAGALSAFNVHLLTRLAHLQAAHMWGLPLVLLAVDGLTVRPSRRGIVLLAVVVAAIASTSIYALALAGVIVLGAMACALGRPRTLAAIAAGAIGGLFIAAPVLMPYVTLARSGATRPLELASQFSATPGGYLASLGAIHAGWSRTFFTTDVNVFFAGVTASVLAVIGWRLAVLRTSDDRRRAILLAIAAGAGILLSFGPSTVVYHFLYEWVVPLRGLRAPARFGYLFLLAVAISAAYGIAWIQRRFDGRPIAAVAAPIALMLVTLEAWHGPVPAVAFSGVPPIYSLLAQETKPVMLVEVPFYPDEAVFENGEYVLNATAHWRPLMNGYSGFTPQSYRDRVPRFWLFPADAAIQAIEAAGATHVMVHLDRFGSDAATVLKDIEARPDLRLMAADVGHRRLYEVIR